MDGLSGSVGFEEPAAMGKFAACDAAVTAPCFGMLTGPTNRWPRLGKVSIQFSPPGSSPNTRRRAASCSEVGLLDSETGPGGFQQRVIGNRDTPSLHQHAQQCD